MKNAEKREHRRSLGPNMRVHFGWKVLASGEAFRMAVYIIMHCSDLDIRQLMLSSSATDYWYLSTGTSTQYGTNDIGTHTQRIPLTETPFCKLKGKALFVAWRLATSKASTKTQY